MGRDRSTLITGVLTRLGDLDEKIWTWDEVGDYLTRALIQLAQQYRAFWDQIYLENLPPSFSHTCAADVTADPNLPFYCGLANYTLDDELSALSDQQARIGPAWYTSPFEATGGWLASVGASVAIPATADVGDNIVEIDRGTWNAMTIYAMSPRQLARMDNRYEITAGQVYAFSWRKDGIRTVRKIRVPAQQAACYSVDGSWGIARDVSDVDSSGVTGTWGIPRRVQNMHPMGPSEWGTPRRFYQDTTNCRFEVWRLAADFTDDDAVCELPTRYADYLMDFALWMCLSRPSPGQDLVLAAHYEQRWGRDTARLQQRILGVEPERAGVFGDKALRPVRPPTPRVPWQYGQEVPG